jgi:hypothetical protein
MLINVKSVLVIGERGNVATLLGTICLQSLDFLIYEAKSLPQFFNLMTLDMWVFASFVRIKALFSKKSFGTLELIIESHMLAHLLVDRVTEHTELVLGIVEFVALRLECVATTDLILAFVVAEHAETVFSCADFLSDAANVAMGLVLQSVELRSKLADF